MRILISHLLMVLSLTGDAQKIKKYSIVKVLIYDDAKKIKLYRTPSETSYKFIGNDSSKDEFYTIVIKNKVGKYYQATATSIFNKKNGYIKLENLGIYTRPRNLNLKLFCFPTTNSKAINIIQGDGMMVKVVGIHSKWLKVTFKIKDKDYSGWLSYEYQCSNPYSTCN